MAEFVHLHNHSDYSLLDGMSRVPEMVKKVAALGMRAVALTDHGNLFGAIEFYQKALEAGIKPILGMEAYVAPGSRKERREAKGVKESSYHLTLLVRNEQGYRNLMKLSSLAYQEGFYYKPRVDKELLAQYHEGLIALSGCPSSEFGHAARLETSERALAVADEYRQIFGPEHYFLEIHNHGMTEEPRITKTALDVAAKLGLKLVGTNDCHYLSRDDAPAHDVLLAIHTQKLVSDPDRLRYPSHEFYLKSPDEMAEAFRETPEAATNTLLVADQCSLELKFGEILLPPFPLPEGFPKAIDYLRHLCEQGMKRLYPEITPALRERLQYEISVIDQMGFASYFLIVWDIRRFARENGVRVGPGRGSAAGSIVSYALGITNIDPIRYDLIFERFLNPGRREMPDIDVDFSNEDRPRVIQYIREKYGHDHVAQIITFGKMKARAVIRDVARALGLEYARADALAKKVPQVLDITLQDAARMEPDLAKLIDSDSQVKHLWEVCLKLEGLNRHASKHASGVLISDRPLVERTPIYVAGEDEATQYEMNAVAKLGLLKIDVLGLEMLTVLDRAVRLVEKNHGVKIELERIPLDDRKTYDMLGKGIVKGVFQLETSRGMRELAQKMKPDRIEDLIATIALFRPGPLGSGMVDQYIDCKHGKQVPKYLHPSLEEVLRETNGVLLYQEQVMRIANRLAGFPMSDADALRKAMGKKKPELLAKYRDPFLTGAAKNGIAPEIAQQIFDLMAFFAGYGFNKSHSAAYGIISYQTAYLKANYPIEYMAALLSCSAGDADKTAGYLEDCRQLKIPVLPPDVNQSGLDFTVIDGRIRFGLACVKGAGEKAILSLIAERDKKGPFRSFFDFCDRIDPHAVDRKTIENLIKCGSFDTTGARRAALLEGMENALRSAAVRQQERTLGQLTIFGASENGKDPELPDVPEWPQETFLGFEKEAVGFYVTSNPIVKYEEILRSYSTSSIEQLASLEENTEVRLGGIISNLRAMITKNGPNKGNKYITFRFGDLTGTCEAVAFTKDYEKNREQFYNDNIVILTAQVGFRNDEPSLRVRQVLPIEQARQEYTGGVHVRIPATGLADDSLRQLKTVFSSHPGTCPVFFEVPVAGGRTLRIRTPDPCGVSPSDPLIADIEEVMGAGSVRFSGKPAPAKPAFSYGGRGSA